MLRSRDFWTVVFVGGLLGGLGVMLSVLGNPENSGICVSCFIENSAGALGLHDNANMQYLRPELLGFVLGPLMEENLRRAMRYAQGDPMVLIERPLSGGLLAASVLGLQDAALTARLDAWRARQTAARRSRS